MNISFIVEEGGEGGNWGNVVLWYYGRNWELGIGGKGLTSYFKLFFE